MRDLTAKRNVIDYDDPISGLTHTIFYRLPTNDERVAYSSDFVLREGDEVKVREDVFAVRLKHGSKLILGFQKGTLGVDGKAIASDPDDEDFCKEWKDHLVAGAPEVVVAVAALALGGGRAKAGEWSSDGGDPAPLPSE